MPETNKNWRQKIFSLVQINLMECFIFMIHFISFIECPIDSRKLKSSSSNETKQERPEGRQESLSTMVKNHQEQKSVVQIKCEPTNSYLIHDYDKNSIKLDNNDTDNNWIRFLCHPVRLFKVIKSYHMSNNYFLFYMWYHLFLLIHLTLKTLVQSQFLNQDELLNYDYTLYPIFALNYSNPYLFTTLFMLMSFCCLIFRLKNIYNVIRRSILNRNHYIMKYLRVSQVNLAYLSLFNITLEDWANLFKVSWKHKDLLKFDKDVARYHYQYDDDIIVKFDSTPKKDLFINENIVNFDKCYELNFNSYHKLMLNNRPKRYRFWHCIKPIHRVDLSDAKLFIYGWLLWLSFSIIMIGLSNYWILFVELSGLEPKPLKSDSSASVVFSSTRYMKLGIKEIIRILEILTFVCLQIPYHCDAMMVYLDFTIIISRARFVYENLEFCLNECIKEREKKRMIIFYQDPNLYKHNSNNFDPDNNGIVHDTQIESHPSSIMAKLDYNTHDINYSDDICAPMKLNKQSVHDQYMLGHNRNTLERKSSHSKRKFNLNKDLRRHVRVIGLIHSEFNQFKSNHSLLLNMFLISGAICMSYALSLLSTKQTYGELFVSVLCACSFFIPATFLIGFLIFTERLFKRIHKIICDIIVNEALLLDIKTLDLLQIGSKQFENREDRSILILGLYAITVDSLGPFIAFMATAILFLNKYVSVDYIPMK